MVIPYLFRLGMTEGEEMVLGNKNIDKMDCFIYLGSIIYKDDGYSENVKSRAAKALGIFFGSRRSSIEVAD